MNINKIMLLVCITILLVSTVQAAPAMVAWADYLDRYGESIQWNGVSFNNQQQTPVLANQWHRASSIDIEPSNNNMIMLIGSTKYNNAPKSYYAGTWDQTNGWTQSMELGGSVHYYRYFQKTQALESYGINNNVLAIYSDDTNTPRYRTWDGTWSPESSANAADGVPMWMELARDPTSDDMVLVFKSRELENQNTYDNVNVQVWTGTTFDSQYTREFETRAAGIVDVAYDRNGNAIVVWNDYTRSRIQYAIWNGATWTGPSDTLDITSGDLSYPYSGSEYLEINCDPNSDECILVSQSYNGAVRMQVWDGTSWTTSSFLGTGGIGMSHYSDYHRTIDVKYDTQGRALIVWVEADEDTTRYRLWNNGAIVAAGTAFNDPNRAPLWIELAADPASDEMILTELIQNNYPYHSTGRVYSQVWDGTQFANYNLLEDDYTLIHSNPLDVEYFGEGGDQPITECNDGIDNDGDGATDYPDDPGCTDYQDDDETDCYTDNDCPIGSYYASYCAGLDFTEEFGSIACINPGTGQSRCEMVETGSVEFCENICSDTLGCDYTQCSDNIDNDNDNLIDLQDPGCEDLYDDDEFNTQPQITSLECFDYVVVNHDQSCSVYVEQDGEPAGNVEVNIIYEDDVLFGTCITDPISGGCEVQDLQTEADHYAVYATTEDMYEWGDPRFDYEVLEERYDIQNLYVYNDENYSQEDYDFFRGESLYVAFQVFDMFTNQLVDNTVNGAQLVSPPGGRVALEEDTGLGLSNWFYYALDQIPTTHDFLGLSQVFTFAFNFDDYSGGEEEVNLIIRNNPPVITPIPDIETADLYELDLASYEFDVEDSGSDLTWTVSGSDEDLFDAEIIGKTLRITPRQVGEDEITLTLTDLDGDSDSQSITVTITDVPDEYNNRLYNDDISILGLRVVSDEYLHAGDVLQLSVYAENHANKDLENIKIAVVVQELGISRRNGPFDLDQGEGVNKRIFLDIPEDAAPGYYSIRMTVSNDDIRRVKYRDFFIE